MTRLILTLFFAGLCLLGIAALMREGFPAIPDVTAGARYGAH
jgi:hypothetical protein